MFYLKNLLLIIVSKELASHGENQRSLAGARRAIKQEMRQSIPFDELLN